MTKDHSYKKPRINKIGGNTASSYNWVNDPFTDKLPHERHKQAFIEDMKGRESRKISNPTKGRAGNL